MTSDSFHADIGWTVDRARWSVDWTAWYAGAAQRSARFTRMWRPPHMMRYGADERQVIHLHVPHDGEPTGELLAFVHGGGLRSGHPRFYDFLAMPYVTRGIAFATIGYRLTPAVEPVECLTTWRPRSNTWRATPEPT